MDYARIVRDSITAGGYRVTTFELRYRRYIHSELMTHRVFSRNSASSRAIPLFKQLEKVEIDPVLPPVWPAEQKGMQGGDEVPLTQAAKAEREWLAASGEMVERARAIGEAGVHKSVPNRLLEPFLMHTVVVTATAFDNFFALRANPMAEPSIKLLAELMLEEYEKSTPTLLHEREWHLPYIDHGDIRAAEEFIYENLPVTKERVTALLVKMSSARCARTSYETQDGKRSPADDLVLYDRLTSADPMHASPLEHPCTPAPWNVNEVQVQALPPFVERPDPGTVVSPMVELTLPMYGNLLGWHQHRFDVEAMRNYRAYA